MTDRTPDDAPMPEHPHGDPTAETTPIEPVEDAAPTAPQTAVDEAVGTAPAHDGPTWTSDAGGAGAPGGVGGPGFPPSPLGHPGQSDAPLPPPRNGLRGAFSRAWSSTGGKVATILAAVVATFAVLGLIGALAFGVAARHVMAGRGDDGRWSKDGRGMGQGRDGMGRGQHGWGDDGERDGMGPNGMGPNGVGPDGMGPDGMGPNGMGPDGTGGDGLGGGLVGAGGVMHGTVTIDLAGQPTELLVQTGQVTAYAPGKSIAVKSTDGFTATYTLGASTRLRGTPATGGTVTVLARKAGAAAIRVRVLG